MVIVESESEGETQKVKIETKVKMKAKVKVVSAMGSKSESKSEQTNKSKHESKGSHRSKNTGILWNTFIKRWPPPPVPLLWNPFFDFHKFWENYYFFCQHFITMLKFVYGCRLCNRVEYRIDSVHVSLWTCGVMGLLHCPFDQFFTSSFFIQITFTLVSPSTYDTKFKSRKV